MYLVITNSSIDTDNTVSESNYRICNFCNDYWNDTADYYNYKYNKINYNIYKIKKSHSRRPTYILDSVFESAYTNDVSTDDELSLVQGNTSGGTDCPIAVNGSLL